MATYYLFDMHVPVVANARLVDVVVTTPSSPEIRVDGLTPIRVPDGVRVINPMTLTDLLDQKYASLLALYPGFANIVYDDLLDAPSLEPADVTTRLRKRGSRSTAGGLVQTSASDPNLDVAPAVISQCVFVCEHYTWRYVDARDGRVERYYVEQPEGAHPSRVSVDGGGQSTFATSGELVTFIPGEQGSIINISFFDRTSPESAVVDGQLIHIGSWAVIY